ncbi:hypothetical protein JM93_00304 [Roseibium hamelinense]|uniref:Uncharacterized protein n=1 Tax=Roseibium hamelinense TaxID=150831 RepID=A0A562THV0_9HYPH|nr:hypothetical protein JM93_00304 [Roseibium hamelinense]
MNGHLNFPLILYKDLKQIFPIRGALDNSRPEIKRHGGGGCAPSPEPCPEPVCFG